MKAGNFLTVGELAKKMNISVRTLQYYDRKGLLKPAALSAGGRRLYSAKDVIKLHQIVALKYLGFSLADIRGKILSLDTPEQVAAALEQQQLSLEEQIRGMEASRNAIIAFREEVLQMHEVNFDRYANIISLLKMNNEHYWVLKLFDFTLSDHLEKRFAERPEFANDILNTYLGVVDEGIQLKKEGIPPSDEKAIQLAERWWNMVLDFTGGDMTLLPRLIEFNNNKSKWPEDMSDRQHEIDEYIEQALSNYFAKKGISFPGLESENGTNH